MTANEYYFEQVSELLEDRLEKEGTICLADVKEDLSKIPQHGKHSKKSEFISYDQMARAFTAIMKCMLEMKRAKKGHQHGHYIITLKDFEKQFNESLSGCSPEYSKPVKIEIFKTKNK